MELIMIILPKSKIEVCVKVYRKKIKNVRLKVFPNGEVALSAPHGVSEEWIKQFLEEKSIWIENKRIVYKKTDGVESIIDIKSGMSIKVLGREAIIIIQESSKKSVERDGKKIYINTLDTNNKNVIKKQFESWLKDELRNVIDKKLDKLYPIIEKYKIDKPEMFIRKMKTMWGNCMSEKGKITLNFYLYQAPPPYIEYVLLHELVHFLYPNHSKKFYDFLSMYMPDWKDRKKNLDYEVIQGVTLD